MSPVPRRSFLSSFRAEARRAEDPEPGGAREREPVEDTLFEIVREQIAFGAALFRVSAALRPE